MGPCTGSLTLYGSAPGTAAVTAVGGLIEIVVYARVDNGNTGTTPGLRGAAKKQAILNDSSCFARSSSFDLFFSKAHRRGMEQPATATSVASAFITTAGCR